MPYHDVELDEHVYLDQSTSSMKERIDFACRGRDRDASMVIGSKIKFDPYGFLSVRSFEILEKAVEQDVCVIMLRRSYFDIFQSWKVFGIRHLANTEIDRSLARDKNLVDKMIAHHSIPIEYKKIVITADGSPMFSLDNESGDIIYYPIEDAVDDFLVLFYNDMMALASFRHVEDLKVVGYEDIDSSFRDLARTLNGTISNAECDAVLNNSLTLKIEPENAQLTYPEGPLREISEYLDSIFDVVLENNVPIEDLICVHEGSSEVAFMLPGLSDMLAKHCGGHQLRRNFIENGKPWYRRLLRRGMDADVWVAQRPVYLPQVRGASRSVASA